MASTTYIYRAPLKGARIEYEQWRDEASCNGLPTHLFELSDSEEVTREYQELLISKGLRVCAACPVRQACKDNSNALDRYWTTRGGQPPEGLFPDSQRPKPELPNAGTGAGGVKDPSKLPKPKEKCHKGHNNWALRADARSRRCKDCERERGRERERTRAPRKRNRNPKADTIES